MNGTLGTVTYRQYAQAGKEFFDLLPTSTIEQAENGLKALGIMYLGLDWDSLTFLEKINAPRLLDMATRRGLEHIVLLELQDVG